jgi:K+-sensing histidine kinase KdpD
MIRDPNVVFPRSIQLEVQSMNAPVLVCGPIDTWADQYPFQAQLFRSESLNEASMLCVPLLGRSVENGTISVRRNTARPFEARDVALLEGFADQALIAIENSRLFNELQDSIVRCIEAGLTRCS